MVCNCFVFLIAVLRYWSSNISLTKLINCLLPIAGLTCSVLLNSLIQCQFLITLDFLQSQYNRSTKPFASVEDFNLFINRTDLLPGVSWPTDRTRFHTSPIRTLLLRHRSSWLNPLSHDRSFVRYLANS